MRHLAPPLSLVLFAASCSDPAGPSSESASAATEGSSTSSGTPTTSTGTAPTTTGGSGSTGSATTEGPTTGSGADVPGCSGGSFLPVPEDTSLPGPWPVGARTVAVDGLTVEVWYPAELGSEAGQEAVRYDVRQALPDSEQGKVSDADNPWQDCGCYRDLPLDASHGPYPAVIFVHGTAGFRSQSLEHMVHWASRGFVVMAADHPGLWLKDMIGSLCGQGNVPRDLEGDLAALVAAIQGPAGELAFLADHVDGERLAMAGHSAGGMAITGGGSAAQVLIPMAAGGTEAGPALQSTLVLGAEADMVVAYSQQQSGYASSPTPRRLVGITNAGHLAFSSLCSLENAQGQDFLEVATANMVCGAQLAGFLFDCEPTYVADATSWEITQYASSAVLESVLRCTDAADNFAALQARFPDVGEFLEDL